MLRLAVSIGRIGVWKRDIISDTADLSLELLRIFGLFDGDPPW